MNGCGVVFRSLGRRGGRQKRGVERVQGDIEAVVGHEEILCVLRTPVGNPHVIVRQVQFCPPGVDQRPICLA